MTSQGLTLAERLLRKVREAPNGCWIWTGGTFANGYPQFRVGAKVHMAARVAYELEIGPIPKGMKLWRPCSKLCVNPDHASLTLGGIQVMEM